MSARSDPDPVTAEEFAASIEALGPFEPAPLVAVAVSGGADSMALLLLAAEWARARGGDVVALSVDHGLRTASAEEAERVADWCGARGLCHEILRIRQPIRGSVQEAARAARYALLEARCIELGCLHLLLGHHRRDQAETVLLRLARGSGLDGLAGMDRVVHRPQLRWLRPLLDTAPDRLRATCCAREQPWIEDPSNRSARFDRARLRLGMAAIGSADLLERRLAETAGHLGRAQAAIEAGVADLAARAVTVTPWLSAALVGPALRAAPGELALRLLARLLAIIGGTAYPPRFGRLEALMRALAGAAPIDRTLGGCRIISDGARVRLFREAAAIAPPMALEPGIESVWDGRFAVRLDARAGSGWRIGALGVDAARAKRDAGPGAPGLDAAEWLVLPALRSLDGHLVIPHLSSCRVGPALASIHPVLLCARPARPLTEVVHSDARIIEDDRSVGLGVMADPRAADSPGKVLT